MVISVNNRIGLDCQEWIDALRADRNLLTNQRDSLQALLANGQIPHDDLPAVDHFENQFEIQLSNINHLKHSIKEHLHSLETTPPEQLSAPHLTVHESLSDQFSGLSTTIEELKREFSIFYQRLSDQ
jgi:hypothetical protein